MHLRSVELHLVGCPHEVDASAIPRDVIFLFDLIPSGIVEAQHQICNDEQEFYDEAVEKEQW